MLGVVAAVLLFSSAVWLLVALLVLVVVQWLVLRLELTWSLCGVRVHAWLLASPDVVHLAAVLSGILLAVLVTALDA